MSVDFSGIGEIISKVFDSDYVDIRRDVGGILQEIYSNVPCHISYSSVDNPDPNTVDIKPIIQSIVVHFPLYVDIRNNDFLVMKRMSNDNVILAVYSGRCGNPVVSQGRQKVLVSMISTEAETPTPVPPTDSVTVIVRCVSENNIIQDDITFQVQSNSEFRLEAPKIDGYKVVFCLVDDVLIDSTVAYIEDVEDIEHVVIFEYAKFDLPDYLRVLTKGLYTKNDGTLANGYHLYKKINIDSIELLDNEYVIECENKSLVHSDNGAKINIGIGTKIVLYPKDVYVEVVNIVEENEKIKFKAIEFTPSEAEKNAYVTSWYD